MTLDEVKEKFGYDLLPWVINTFYPWSAYFPGRRLCRSINIMQIMVDGKSYGNFASQTLKFKK